MARCTSKSMAIKTFAKLVDGEKLRGVYHWPKSNGATAYIITAQSKDGTPLNVMVDPPSYNSAVADTLEEMGGLQLFLMSHSHTIADHNRWKQRFPDVVRVIHKADTSYSDMRAVESQLEGDGPWELAPGLTAVHAPGHTAGSICFLVEAAFIGAQEGALFTGDHLGFDEDLGRLDGFAPYGRDVALQAESMRKLADLPFRWLLPDHGRGVHFQSDDERRGSILSSAEDFAADPYGSGAHRGRGSARARRLHLVQV